MEQRVDRALRILRFPLMEKHLTAWTGFDHVPKPGDTLIYGYADELKQYFLNHCRELSIQSFEKISEYDSHHYYSARYEVRSEAHPQAASRVLNFYECKEHGWGSISALTMTRAAELGVSEILYLSKGATCRDPQDIYQNLMCPTSYHSWQRSSSAMMNGQIVKCTASSRLRNGMTEWMPSLDTGLHISLPTVIEEDSTFRDFLTFTSASSVDNEAAQMALALTTLRLPRQIYFSALQFPTDYLRQPHELTLTIAYDLANNRTLEQAEQLRRRAFRSMFVLTSKYLLQSPLQPPLPSLVLSDIFDPLFAPKPYSDAASISHVPNIMTVVESRNCYVQHLLPALVATPIISCLSNLFLAKPCDDLRIGADGEPLFFEISVAPSTDIAPTKFALIPRPEVHPPSESTSIGQMHQRAQFAFIAFWLHPTFAINWYQRALCSALTPSEASLPHGILKPREGQYLHTIRDLGRTHVPMLRDLFSKLDRWSYSKFGVHIGDDPATQAQCYVQYPSGLSKSSLHAHLCFGYLDPDAAFEHNRKIPLTQLIELLEANPFHFESTVRIYAKRSTPNPEIPATQLPDGSLILGCSSKHDPQYPLALEAYKRSKQSHQSQAIFWADIDMISRPTSRL